MDLQNKFYLFLQIIFIILFIPFVVLSILISLIMTTINNFFHPKEDEDQNKPNTNT